MNYANIKTRDIANGPGVRVSLFVSGCNNHCKGCFNPETWDFNYGNKFTEETEKYIIDQMKPKYISGLTILGGEPLDAKNIDEVLYLTDKIRSVYGNTKSIWIYTGFILKQLTNKKSQYYNSAIFNILNRIDVLVDGPFIEEEKDISLAFRGSRNQRIIDTQYYSDTRKIKELEL
ncbi:MAG: anaerobic ribonucleoside-triphosphate reductase activating protein [Ruminococcus flavefaciens]|nr:anaerobic ribonucleoside-triphosphate reductase activating protein [Ruminococcus flavefaciens]